MGFRSITKFPFQVKDDQIVNLTNQVHENELKNVMNTASVPPSPGGPRTPLPNLNVQKLALGMYPNVSNCILLYPTIYQASSNQMD